MKQIICMGLTSDGIEQQFSVLFWFPITSGAKAQANGSAWSGASPSENAAIEAGTVLEVAESYTFPTGMPVAGIKTYLQQEWANRNTQIAGAGPATDQGVFFDSATGWSA